MSLLAETPAIPGRLRTVLLRTAFAAAAAAAAFVGARADAAPMGSGWTITLTDNSGVTADGGTVWVMGFSTTSQLALGWTGDTGTFSAFPASSGTLSAVALPSGSPSITLDANTALTGARVYFFMGSSSSSAPAVSYSNSGTDVVQVPNPPTTAVPPYGFIEITVPGSGPSALPTIDVQTVDGFTVPISITVTAPGGDQTVGQPIDSGTPVNRASVMAAYTAFMTSLGSLGKPYLPLLYTDNGGGILNPGPYVAAANSLNEFVNLDSPLQSVMDQAAATLFSGKKLSIMGSSSGTISSQAYTSRLVTGMAYPGGTLPHPALQLTGADGTTFYVWSPVGLCQVGTPNGQGGYSPFIGTIVNNRLAFKTPVPMGILTPGMFVQGAGIGTPPTITKLLTITGKGGKQFVRAVELSASLGRPASDSQYLFSKAPSIFLSSGMQIFGNYGVFADSASRETNSDRQKVLGNLELQLVAALNRGVATLAPTSGPSTQTPGYTTAYWANENNWYPAAAKAAQNFFSLFMHVGVVITTDGPATVKHPIFVQNSPTTNARGQKMGQAYGFAYDETPMQMAGAPVPVNVPAKFDPIPVGTTAINVTLLPWNPPTGISIVNGCLLVVGSSDSETITVLPAGKQRMKVLIDGVSQGTFYPVTAGVVILGLDGDDDIVVDRRLMSRAHIDGGAGSNTINGAPEASDD